MTDWIKKQLARFRRLLLFGLVGCANTAVEYGAFYLLYRGLDAAAVPSQWVGYLCGSVCGYVLNSNLTFKEGKGRTRGQLAKYLGIDVVFALVSGLLVGWAEDLALPILPAKIVITAALTLLHYLIFKKFVFRIKEDEG